MPEWTEQQLDAIEARGRNILVSAAAGSGKTAVLVERVIKLITDKSNPIDINRLLVVTFTNAAAAEMKSRISESLKALIKSNPNDENLRRQLSLMPSSKICTIDSFCINLVREYFYLLDINQDFTTMEQSELELLEDKIINEVLDELFDKNDKYFIRLIEQFTTPNSDKQLFSAIKRIIRFIYAQAYPNAWMSAMVDLYNYNIPLEESQWYSYAVSEIEYLINYSKSLVELSLKLLEDDDSDAALKVIDVLNDDLNLIESLECDVNSSWDDLCSSYEFKFKTMARTTNLDPQIASEIKSKREIYKSIITKEIPSFLLSDSKEYEEDMKELYPLLVKLTDIVKEVDCRLTQEKKEMNSFSFSDIEHFAINLIYTTNEKGENVRTEIGKSQLCEYDEILVDEYQDTNEAQDYLFAYLSNGKNLFTVGDVKQSIYRFRLAMPDIFNTRRLYYEAYDKNTEQNNSKIILDKNFRSNKDICSYVNFIFSNLMSDRVGELDYNEEEYLNCGASYEQRDNPGIQMNLLGGVKGEKSAEYEAALIAKVIKEKISSKELIKDGNEYREIRYGDFAIFMRSLKTHINEYAEVLRQNNIPVICDNSSNLFDNQEIKMIISLLRVIDNPTLDISLLAVMMSPIYCFTPDEIAKIRVDNKKKNFYFSVSNSSNPRVIEFLNDIQSLKKLSVTMSVAGFIRYIVEEKSIVSIVNAMGNGEQRYQNILKLISFAKSFDTGNNVGMTSFIRYIDKIIESEKTVESAPLSVADENAVKIMSIHHSKGLQFPVCILAGASRMYNKRDLSEKLLLNNDYGFGLKIHNEEHLYQYQSLPYAVVKSKNSLEAMSENLRVLYVALTRAKEQFITFAYFDNLEGHIQKLAGNITDSSISPYICQRINNDADLLIMCALIHPNGKNLRDLTDFDIKAQAVDFKMSVNIYKDFNYDENKNEIKEELPDKSIVQQISDKLSFKYHRNELSILSGKLTASSLDEIDSNLEFFATSKPAFLSKSSMTPAQRGTAMHTFMQYCSYEGCKDSLESEIERLIAGGYINKQQADSLDIKAIKSFFSSNTAKRIFNSNKIHREYKISAFVKASSIYDTEFDDEILVQGIADCIIEEDDGLVLIDYKTDNVDSEDQLLKRYVKQISFYEYAVSKALGKPVKESLLYSFKLGRACCYKK